MSGREPFTERGIRAGGWRAAVPGVTGGGSGAGTRTPLGDGGRAGISTTEPLPTARDAIFRRLLIVADLVGVVGALLLVGAVSPQGFSAESLTLLPVTVLLAKVAGRYDHEEVVLRKSTLDETPSLLTLAAAISVAWSALSAAEGVPRSHGVGLLWAAASVCLIVCRVTARALARRWAPCERVLVIGTAAARARFARRLSTDPVAQTEVVGFLPLENERKVPMDWGDDCRRGRELSIDELEPLVRELQVGRIFVIGAGAGSDVAYDALAKATSVGVKVSILPNELEVVGSSVELDEVGGLAVLSVRSPGLGRSSRAVKRAFDLTGSLLGLVFLAPLFALIAVAIKLDSPGPVLFCQRRVGRDGKVFGMLKFRSMTDDAEAKQEALLAFNETEGLFKLSADPRVTRVGGLLRKSSLDELPQLLNVLRGEMSLVGPRPLISDEDRLVEGRHRRRLQLAPGMTGPWQVLGPERPPLSEMVKIDFLYAANWSLWSDIKILVRTGLHVTGRRGV